MWFLKILGVYAALIAGLSVLSYAGYVDFAGTVMAIAILLFIPVVVIAAIMHYRKRGVEVKESQKPIEARGVYLTENTSQVEVKGNRKMVETAQKYQEKQNALVEALKENQPKKAGDIVSVKYLGGGTVQEKKYGMKGFLVGGFFGGVPGAVVGSVLPSGKQQQKQKFAVKYSDGSVRIVECFQNSNTYRELIKRVAWEEL